MKPSGTDVIAAIRAAFGNLPPPADVTVGTQGDPECQELSAELKGKRWQSLAPGDVRRVAEGLPLLTPSAFRYYLPGYLVACVSAREVVDVAWDSVIFILTPPKPAQVERRKAFQKRTEGFTTEQARAIVLFLEYARGVEWNDWESSGREPPGDRVGPPMEFWSSRVKELERQC